MSITLKHYKDNFTLAIPVITANIGQAVVQIVDNVMVGRLGATPLAAASFAGIIIMNLFVFGMGIALSLTPLAGHAYASGKHRRVAALFQNSISLNTIIGILLTLIFFAIIPLLYKLGQPTEVVDMAIPFYKLLALSTLPFFLFLAFKQFMEGIGNTQVAMIITIAANVINIILNYIFIYGKLGAPALGIVGAGVATLISRILMPIMFFGYIVAKNPYKRFLAFFKTQHFTIKKHRQLLEVGLPISGQMVIEIFALSVTTIMMGWLSTEALAANQVVLSMVHFTFMVATGISGASTILVSHQYGQKNFKEMRRYAFAGIHMAAAFMIFAALAFVFFGSSIASIFTTDPTVIALAAQMFLVVALFEISDGVQVTALGALRGITDVKRPMVYAFISYLAINIPAAYLFGFILKMGTQGIWVGFLCGLTTAAILFVNRFIKSSSRMIEQKA